MPSVIARLSAVSLADMLHHNWKQSKDSSLALASQANTLSVMAHAACAGASGAACEDVSSATCVDASHSVAYVDVSYATRQDVRAQQVHGRCWAEMVPDALVKIFNHLSLETKLCIIPCVCRAWQSVSQGVSCWQNVDLSEWSSDKQTETLEKMLLLMVNRSQGCLLEICVPGLKNDGMLRLIADSGTQLQVLRIPFTYDVSEECLWEVAPKFASLTYLDISGSCPSGALVKSFGELCPFITRLNLNNCLSDCKSCDTAALSVAEHMPQLKHLEMAYSMLSTVGLEAIIEKCTRLEHLDVRGCWHEDMFEATILNMRRIKAFFSLHVVSDTFNISEDDDKDFLVEDDSVEKL